MPVTKFKCWIEAMRLRTLPVSLAGVIAGCGYAANIGSFRIIPAVLCFAVAFLAQIASNFANEYFDYRNGLDRPGREGPRRGVTEGDITPRAMLTATIATLGAACAAGLCLTLYGSQWIILVGIAIALGVLAYSTGPYPLSHHGLGEVAVVLFFGLIPVNFTAWLQSGAWTSECLLGSISIGLMGANVLIINNYRDADDDLAVGKHTLAVITGPRAMPWLYAANAVAATILVIPQWHGYGKLVPASYLASAVVISMIMPLLKGHRLTPLLGITAVIMFIYSVLFALL